MREVSCMVFGFLIRALEERGVAAETLVADTELSLAWITDHRNRVSWLDFVEIMARLETHFTADELRTLGASFFEMPVLRPFVLPGRLLGPRRMLMWIGNAGAGARLFSCIESRALEHPDGIEIQLTLPLGYQDCPAFYLLSQGALGMVPRLFGEPEARCEMHTLPTGRRLLFDLPPRRRFWVRSLFGFGRAGALAQELEGRNEDLVSQNLELSNAQAELEQSVRQGRTAQRVVGVIHQADLDLQQTMDTVCDALVEDGGFVMATIRLDGLDLTARSGPSNGGESAHEILALGVALGELRLGSPKPGAIDIDEVLPAIGIALHQALTFRELEQLKDSLEERVVKRTAELSLARDELGVMVQDLTSARAARDRVFANINHEIRNPLTLIRLACHQLRRDPEAPGLDAIENATDRLLRLVDGLLTLAASEEGDIPTRLAWGDLRACVGQTVAMWEPAAAERGLQIEFRGPDSLLASFDSAAIDRIVSNLISNALKFTSQGAVVVSLGEDDEDAVLTVADPGVGIPEGDLERVFARFEQGPLPVRPSERGSGIGLSLVKELAEAHNGSVGLESEVGTGTTVQVRFPKGSPGLEVHPSDFSAQPAERPSSEVSRPLPAPLHRGNAPTVLIAEDEDALRQMMADLLASRFMVLAAPDGHQGLALAKQHRPDLLISDVDMPGMDGIELARRFRDLSGNQIAPVMLVTAHQELGVRLSGFEAGVLEVLRKPFHLDELLARTQALLSFRDRAADYHQQDKLLSLGVLSAALAHEIRNPVNAIVNAIDPLQRLLPSDVTDGATPTGRLLAVMAQCADQLAILAEQLLGFVKNGKLERVAHDFGDILDSAKTMLGDRVQNVEVQTNLQHQHQVYCARPFLVQLLVNLVDNAVDAAGTQGVVTVETHSDDVGFTFLVSDSGPGVPRALKDRVFEPFFTMREGEGGTGLGLFTCRQIANRHGGDMEVIYRQGSSWFQVTLPNAPRVSGVKR